MEKLYRVSGRLDKHGFDIVVYDYDIIKQTNNTISIHTKYTTRNKMIKIKNLTVIDSPFYDQVNHFSYFTYCFEKDIEQCKENIKNHIISRLNYYKETLEKLSLFIQ